MATEHVEPIDLEAAGMCVDSAGGAIGVGGGALRLPRRGGVGRARARSD